MIPSIIGLAKLAKMSFDDADMASLWQDLTGRFSEDQTDDTARQNMYAALMDMCVIDQMRGNPERGLEFQAQALAACRLYQIAAPVFPAKLRLLGFVIGGKINANTPIEFLIEDTEVTLLLLYVVPGMPLPPVPEHDIAIVLAADSEQAHPALQELARLTENWPKPVLNPPLRIPLVARECLYSLFAPIAGVEMPATVKVSRSDWEQVSRDKVSLRSIAPGCKFPLIARPVDSHAGDGLEKINGVSEISQYLIQHPESSFYLSPFQDYRSADGQYRKYRIMVIAGEAFPCHMGISDHWMIHYLNAGMAESSEKRREEENFFCGFRDGFGQRHRQSIAEMADVLGLDYFGIDCAEMPDGRLLVFEAGTALVVHRMDPPEIFPYKSAPMHTLFAAFQAMLHRKAHLEPDIVKIQKLNFSGGQSVCSDDAE